MHTHIPTQSEIEALFATENPACVTIYLPTSVLPQEAQADRIAFKNQVHTAIELLRDHDTSRDDIEEITDELTELEEDGNFWANQAHSLAVFATPERVITYQLPNRLTDAVQVSDRFYVKPLLRAVSFPQAAFVLALSQGSVRLVRVSADSAGAELHVPDMPSAVADHVNKASITDRSASGRVQGAEGQKVRMRQFSRAIDRAIRPVLKGSHLPLILAGGPPLNPIFRDVTSYTHLAEQEIEGNPETHSDAELSDAARSVLDQIYAAELADLRDRFEVLGNQGRSVSDVGDVARAATFGAVDTLLVDIDEHVAGEVDETTGAVTFAEDESDGYGVTDEIARRTLGAGGRVVAVRAEDLPGGGPVAALLRYQV